MNPITSDIVDREFGHPLRVIPWFRRLPKTTGVSMFLTAVLSIVLGVAFAAFGPIPYVDFPTRLKTSLVHSFAIGYCIQFLSTMFVPKIRVWLRAYPFFIRLFANLLVWVVGVALGIAIASTLLDYDLRYAASTPIVIVAMTVLLSVFTGVVLRQYALRELKAEREKHERTEAARTIAMCRLQILQAQIEPHFLFNTLANVSSLIECDPKQARKMLDEFTLLLRASLDQTRKDSTSLRAELQVANAYLSVLKVRMGERLGYEVHAPEELLDLPLPSMLLQPIVENAVKHGIEPRLHGGSVRVNAQQTADGIALIVADNGIGFAPNARENVGLGAVRERLAVQFAGRATLSIERTDGWTLVSIHIPMPA